MKYSFSIDNKEYRCEEINKKKVFSLYIDNKLINTRSFKLSATKADIGRMFDFCLRNNLK